MKENLLLLKDVLEHTYHRTIKMKPVDVKDNTYINIAKEINDKDLKFKVHHVRSCKNIK